MMEANSILSVVVACALSAPAFAGRVSGRVSFDTEAVHELAADASAAERQRYRAANKVVLWVNGLKDATPPGEHAKLLQGGSQFHPPLLVVTAGQSIDIINNDSVMHGAFSESRVNAFDTGLKNEGETAEVTLDRPGLVRVGCPLHDDMACKIVVVPNSFHAVIDPGQPFVIPDLPAGEYSISAWRDGYARQTQVVQVEDEGTAKLDFELSAQQAEPTEQTAQAE